MLGNGERRAGDRQPAARAHLLDRRITFRHRLFEIRRRRQQRAEDSAAARLRRPMRDRDHAAAMGDDDDRPVDRLGLPLDRLDLGCAVEIGAAHRRDRPHARQPRSEQRLPVRGDMVPQARHDQYGRRPSSVRLLRRPAAPPAALAVRREAVAGQRFVGVVVELADAIDPARLLAVAISRPNSREIRTSCSICCDASSSCRCGPASRYCLRCRSGHADPWRSPSC